jgi:ubiquitin C-terminal hydrolase
MSIDADSLKAYNENKSKLADALKKNGSKIFLLLPQHEFVFSYCTCTVGLSLVNRPSHGHVGLWNQGATCYLNSVIQTMFWDVEFRNSLFAGAGGDNAVLNQELKRLVTQLKLSEQPAVSTKPLTVAFGWKDGQSHEQHDAHELYSLLLDSMDASSKALFEAKMKGKLPRLLCT